MSFVVDQVRRIDVQLDRLQLYSAASGLVSPLAHPDGHGHPAPDFTRLVQLQTVVRSFSTASSAQTLLSVDNLQNLLERAELSKDDGHGDLHAELEWLIVSKATAQTYGLILDALLGQIIPLSNDIWYWDDVLGSYSNSGLYSLQTSPFRLLAWSKDIYRDSQQRLNNIVSTSERRGAPTSLSTRWSQFYGLVKESIRERSLADMQSKFMSPLTQSRLDARRKQNRLKKLREMSACGLGVLINEGLNFEVDDAGSVHSRASDELVVDDWKSVVAKSIALMETVLRNVNSLETSVNEFEDRVFATVEEDAELVADEHPVPKPAILGQRLDRILSVHMREHAHSSSRLAAEYGRPSRLVRYWLPAAVLLLSSGTLLRIFFRRKEAIIAWLRDLGATTRDFWFNWVVEPIKKTIGTIRHDKDSEIALMSKESLKGDRDSLERMVVDFAVDNAPSSTGSPLTEAQVADVRAKVREGDLTPVLRAYEKDLRSPFKGTIRGDLIRALLIQIQKTKVDVEVAVGGIDNLLKSQELVFAFVGLTPSVLVCVAASRWLANSFGGRSSSSRQRQQGRMVRVLRNIDRILSMCTPSPTNMLSYKEHGLLLCEVHILRQNAQRVMPGEVLHEFLEDVNELVDIRTGVERQLKVVERIRWAYWRWLQ